jgi:hypothetical protein
MSTPADLGSDLLGWFPDSDLTFYNEGDYLSRYSDTSSGGNHFVEASGQSNWPICHVSEYNGLKCVRFDGGVDSALGQNNPFNEGTDWVISIALFLPSIIW